MYETNIEKVDVCVHRLRAEGGSNHKHLPTTNLAFDLCLSSRTPIDHLHLDTSVLLRSVSLSVLAVVVHAGLAVLGTVNGIALTEFDFA